MKWVAAGTVGGWNESEVNGRKKSRSLLWLVTLTRSCCAQRQSIRHPALLLMSTGNKSDEAGLYFAAWVTCQSRHRPMCPCIPPQLTSPGLSFTCWESLPLVSLLLLSVIPLPCRYFVCFFCFFASPLCSFDTLSISNVCAVYLFDDSMCICA